jgi:predicted porin
MKKSLLVLAVAAAVPMLAQAQTNVTLYGRIDAAIGYEKAGANPATNASGSAISLLSGVQSSNRWGVRGSEDLGGGLKAIFNLEGGFDADIGRGFGQAGQQSGISNTSGGFPAGSPATTVSANTAGGLDFRRRSVVGVEGGFGTLVLGRDYDPLFRVLLGSDNLGLGHYNNVHTTFGTGYGVRIDNGIHYVSPSLGGFVGRLAYGFSEQFVAPKAAGRSVSFAGEYSTGPLYVGLGYRANSLAVGSNKFTALGARYNFGAFAINGGAGINNPFGANNDTRSLWVGGDAQVGPGRLHVQFGTAKTNVLGANDPKQTALGVTYNYPLSKRTNLYVTGGALKNNAFGAFNLTTSSTFVSATGQNGDPKGLALGVGHNF